MKKNLAKTLAKSIKLRDIKTTPEIEKDLCSILEEMITSSIEKNSTDPIDYQSILQKIDYKNQKFRNLDKSLRDALRDSLYTTLKYQDKSISSSQKSPILRKKEGQKIKKHKSPHSPCEATKIGMLNDSDSKSE
jgi:hypothetical protein